MKKKKTKKEPMNRITCMGVKGIYKDQEIEIELGPTHQETNVFINGKPVDFVQSIHISAKVGEVTTIQIEKIKTLK